MSFINYRPRVRSEHALAREEVRKIIARNHNFDWHDEDAFEDWDTIKNSETVGKIFDAMDLFLGGVGIVTLTLGAIGIINIMLVAVSERTREIGLRKALGATNRSILLQFFLEGAFLTLMSGAIGMGGAALLMFMMRGVGEVPGFDPPTHVVHVGNAGDRNAGGRRNRCWNLSRAQSRNAAAGRRTEAGVGRAGLQFLREYSI